ncbi:RNA cytidine acetyltransferase isoform X2 [Adelges cooleyi]|uniref:RNA cytidine acetyltransferase isoform X2 n=1 Tax=Adelges cooleyi TaxID=133065 RepID=UPI00217FAB90|nr:RNA cytidine acetyltransferase isoform X2 [Adelges cooleyi]
MVRKKIDNRIRTLIENGVTAGHRTMFVIVGDKGRDQVVILHHMLTKAAVKARPNVLWCYKKELGFSSHRKKRMKTIQHKVKAGKLNVNEDDPFELFVASTNIRYCYYSETHKILGNTYGMCVLQDFEALTPNLLARTIETVEGGGLIIFLLRSLKSLKQLYTLTMDVHERFRTEAHQDVVARFNERFMLSLVSSERCLVVDDQLTVLPISSKVLDLVPTDKITEPTINDQELTALKENMKDTQPVGCLVNCCKTVDQAKALLTFIEAISEKTLRSTVSLTASRGRGKSAALGIAVASAVAFGYSNIFVTSPSPENLKTFFEFVFKGFDALGYQEHLDYGIVRSTNPDDNKALVRVNIFRDHRQTIQYIIPADSSKLSQAELVVIDEAAAIPLPLVKAMLGSYLVFLASTINGYEGTGRSLSLKLLQQLRSQATPIGNNTNDKAGQNAITGRFLKEVTLEESIRYKPGDDIEKWLTQLLCLDATNIAPLLSGCPPPDTCELYYINRDTLFCYHKASEAFLQRIVSLYVASHYKNSPNDLQMMSDAPAHHLFCLLGPVALDMKTLPEVLCVIQVCLEGEVSQTSATEALKRGKRAAGDLIPWTISGCFQDEQFPSLSGARIVRIATHPDYQSMGYGSRALSLLKMYYEFLIPNVEEGNLPKENIESIQDEEINILEERIEPRNNLPPLLLKLSERPPERLDYIGVSFGLTGPLLKFWKKSGFIPLYIRQTNNELTGEHSCIMISSLNSPDSSKNPNWLPQFWTDFRRRFISLLGYQFRKFSPQLALGVLHNTNIELPSERNMLSKMELDIHLSVYDVLRLEKYCNNMADYHLIMDLLPTLSKLYFQNKFGDTHFSAVQKALLLGLGLQYKNVEELATQFDLVPSQLLGLYNRMMRRMLQTINTIMEQNVDNEMPTIQPIADNELRPLAKPLDEELEQAAKVLKKKQRIELEKLKQENLNRYAIKGTEDEWGRALGKTVEKKE